MSFYSENTNDQNSMNEVTQSSRIIGVVSAFVTGFH